MSAVKGQIKPLVWHAIDSPKKQANEVSFFCCQNFKFPVFPDCKEKKIDSFGFWENLRHANFFTVLSVLYWSCVTNGEFQFSNHLFHNYRSLTEGC